MSNRNLILLLAAAVVLGALTGLLYVGEEKSKPSFESGTPLVQGLPVEKVHRITINGSQNSVTLQRSGDSFVLAGKGSYPAAVKKVNNLLTSILDIRCKRKVTDSADNYAELGVKKGASDATVISFYNDSNKRLLSVIKGTKAKSSPGSYVRRSGEDTVYLTKSHVSVNSSPLDYVDKNLLSLSKDKIQQVSVKLKDKSYTLAPGDSGKASLKNVPEGKQPVQSACDSVFSALTNVRLQDITKAGKLDLSWDGTYTCRMKNGLTYVVRTAKKDDAYYAKLSAKAANGDVKITGTESEEKLKQKKKARKTAKKAQNLTQTHKGWVYKLAGWQAKKLRKPLSDLVEKKTPDKISARQILISYKGAKQSKADRSKSEAKKLAQKLHRQLTKKDASFAKLAQKHSDGPSADKGGKLGTVKKGSRNESFEDAAFSLKPGDMSEVVESPYGFHIIQRVSSEN